MGMYLEVKVSFLREAIFLTICAISVITPYQRYIIPVKSLLYHSCGYQKHYQCYKDILRTSVTSMYIYPIVSLLWSFMSILGICDLSQESLLIPST